MPARAYLESLLKARKLDVTLTHLAPWRAWDRQPQDVAETGVPALDSALGGGLRRGHLSEIVGSRSSGRTSVLCHALAAATSRDELVALIDTNDRFDPLTAASAGLDLSRLLWVRDSGDAARALKAMSLVLQAGGFGLVVLDLTDVVDRVVRGLPFTTWFRLARIIEGSQTVALLMASEHLGRSSGGSTIALERPSPSALWAEPGSHRARLLSGLDIRPRVI